jgi:hypothetical protein
MLAAHAKQEVTIMKISFPVVVIALAVTPVAALAQSQASDPPTHAQLVDQLTQLRQNGYMPSKIHYPADIEAAQARGRMQASTGTASNSGVGGAAAGASQSGSRMTIDSGFRSMYGRH